MPSVCSCGTAHGRSGERSRPAATCHIRAATVPSRLATSSTGMAANSPQCLTPRRARLSTTADQPRRPPARSATSRARPSAASGSGASHAASPPGATRMAPPRRRAAPAAIRAVARRVRDADPGREADALGAAQQRCRDAAGRAEQALETRHVDDDLATVPGVLGRAARARAGTRRRAAREARSTRDPVPAAGDDGAPSVRHRHGVASTDDLDVRRHRAPDLGERRSGRGEGVDVERPHHEIRVTDHRLRDREPGARADPVGLRRDVDHERARARVAHHERHAAQLGLGAQLGRDGEARYEQAGEGSGHERLTPARARRGSGCSVRRGCAPPRSARPGRRAATARRRRDPRPRAAARARAGPQPRSLPSQHRHRRTRARVAWRRALQDDQRAARPGRGTRESQPDVLRVGHAIAALRAAARRSGGTAGEDRRASTGPRGGTRASSRTRGKPPMVSSASTAAKAVPRSGGRTHSSRSRSAPAATALAGSKASGASIHAATCACAVTCASRRCATLVRPVEAGPTSSLSWPRGSPPSRTVSSVGKPVARRSLPPWTSGASPRRTAPGRCSLSSATSRGAMGTAASSPFVRPQTRGRRKRVRRAGGSSHPLGATNQAARGYLLAITPQPTRADLLVGELKTTS